MKRCLQLITTIFLLVTLNNTFAANRTFLVTSTDCGVSSDTTRVLMQIIERDGKKNLMCNRTVIHNVSITVTPNASETEFGTWRHPNTGLWLCRGTVPQCNSGIDLVSTT